MKNRFCFVSFLFIGLFSWGQYMVKTIAQPNQLKIGQQFIYTIKVTNTKKAVFAPLLLPSDVVVVKKEKPIVVGNSIQQKYTLTSFNVGQLVLPAQKVKINQQWYLSNTAIIGVTTVPIDEKRILMNERVRFYEQEELTLAEIWYQYQWVFWLLIITSVFVYGIVKYFYKRPKSTKEIKQYWSPYQLAVKRIQELNYQKLWEQQMVKKHYDELSIIIRTYIAQETSLQGLESTTQELLVLLKAYNQNENFGFDEVDFKNLEVLLAQSDFVKFAKQIPTATEVSNHTTMAIAFIEKIYQLKNNPNPSVNEIK